MNTPGNITVHDWVTDERRYLHYVATSANFRTAVVSLYQTNRLLNLVFLGQTAWQMVEPSLEALHQVH
jgi:hypothetical protein